MARKAQDSARAAVREIGRVTILRLTIYYFVAGVLLICLSVLIPNDAVPPVPVQPPADLAGALGRLG